VTAVRDLLTLVYDHKFRDAERKVVELQRRFRGAAGIAAARCDLEIRRRAYPAARGHCREAIRSYDGSSWAHYLTGLLDKRDKNPAAAIKHLERAIALDPDLEHAYQVSAELYTQLKRDGDRKRIAEEFQTRFGRPMPK
jgi:tetratricopeptide (TPR) repeat protein